MNAKILPPISRALFDTDLIGVRSVLALSEFLWAIMLFWPGDTFSRPTYTHMARVMPEDAWAAVFLVSGITQITIVMLEDYHSRYARYFAAWNASLWVYVVLSMMVSVYPPPAAIGGEISLALSALWIWVRPYVLAEGYKRARCVQ